MTALVFLTMMTLLGITAMSTNTLEERMAANSQDINRAFQAAESGAQAAFANSNSFAGTTSGYSFSNTTTLGGYAVDLEYSTAYRTSEPISGFQDITQISDGKFRWHFFDMLSESKTQSGALVGVGAGVKVLGQ